MSDVDQSKFSTTVYDVLNHRAFLKMVDEKGLEKYYDPGFIANAIRRYESNWIPLILQLSKDYSDDLKYAPPFGKNNLFFL